MLKKTVKYSELTGQRTQGLIQKLGFTPTAFARSKQLSLLVKPIKAKCEAIREEFMKEILPKFAEKNEDGTIKKSKDENWSIPDDQAEAFMAEQEKFGEREAVLEIEEAISQDAFADIKMTASEVEWLGDFVVDGGPGVPQSAGPIPMRKS